jgi:hypothetical protein
LPVFRFDKAIGMARKLKAFVNPEGHRAHDAATSAERREERTRSREERERNRKRSRRLTSERKQRLRSEIKSKKRELARVKEEPDGAEDKGKRSDGIEQPKVSRRRRSQKARQELLRLRNELRAAKDGAGEEPQTGALPDFVIIGTGKSGTTFLYRLLTQHPYVQPAAKKELHFFDLLFDEGTEWYRERFPTPRWKDGRRTITGEATPTYIHRPLVPERMAKVIPQARLIALVRNPVDRTYSAYHHRVRHGKETRTFEEALEVDLDDGSLRYLSKGVYVENLVRWSKFFSKEQLLVLKSEDLFEHPQQTLKAVLDFLDLPEWEPQAWEVRINKGEYEQGMDPSTRRLLQDYFEPHNRRLYDYLGVDLGW